MRLQTTIDVPPTIFKDIMMAFDDDYIRELGDRIANLTLAEAQELNEYLKELQ